MTTEDLEKLWRVHDGEYLKFASVENRRSNRPDLHAFCLIDSIFPGSADIVSHAEHDQFWLGVYPENLAEKITEAQIIELIRSGVMLERGIGFFMFT